MSEAPRHAGPADVTGLWNDFEGKTGEKTFYGGPLSWLNNLVASAEDVWQWASGSNTPEEKDEWWGCADASPHLLKSMTEGLAGTDQVAENLTTRNWLGMQHNQVVTHNRDGSPGGERVFDPWAGSEQALPEHFDNTILPIGQLLEGLTNMLIGGGFSEGVEPTGYGGHHAVTGNTRLDVSGPAMSAVDWFKDLF